MKPIILSIVFSLALPLIVHANPVTYTFSGTGSGTFGSDSFFNTPFTITSTADTDSIIETNIIGQAQAYYFVSDITAMISVFGLGMATFTDPTEIFDNQTGGAGIESINQDLDMLDGRNSAFQNYDLSESIGPVAGVAAFNAGWNFSTTDGNFSLTEVYYNAVTFQAEVVPEPSVFSLAFSIFGTIVAFHKLRRKHIII